MAWSNLENDIGELFADLSGCGESDTAKMMRSMDNGHVLTVYHTYQPTSVTGSQAQTRNDDPRYRNKYRAGHAPNYTQALKTKAAKSALGFYPVPKRYVKLVFRGGNYLSPGEVEAIVEALKSGLSLRKTSALLGCSRGTVIRYKKLFLVV